jgi:hypothetical protein
MTETPLERAKKIDALADALERMWSGGGGEYGVYTVANQREKVRELLHELLREPNAS